ncbi:MAG: molybdopterin-dependent oxidoreductase [Granulosicoccus sp.]
MVAPGQKARADFPRFGLPTYATRFPSELDSKVIDVDVNGQGVIEIDFASMDLPRSSIQADFHCVTTWSCIGLNWSGVRFTDFYRKYIHPLEKSDDPIVGCVVYAQDGYKTTLTLEDLLSEDVILADMLDGKPLTVEHGAPLRLVMPAHYGYKNLKHLTRVEFYARLPVVKRGLRAFLDHPRGRVKQEERGRWVPGWILRYVYRPLISGTVNEFRVAMKEHRDGGG